MSLVTDEELHRAGAPFWGRGIRQLCNHPLVQILRGPRGRKVRRYLRRWGGRAQPPRLQRKGRLPSGYLSLGPTLALLLLAGLAQGCAHKAAGGPPAATLLSDATEPQPLPEQPPEPPSAACKRLDDARLFWGVWAKVCGTLSGGAAAGTVATAGDPQKVVGISGLGLLACSVATGYLETELAVRHTRQCPR